MIKDHGNYMSNEEWIKFDEDFSNNIKEISLDPIVAENWKQLAKNLLIKSKDIDEIDKSEKNSYEKIIRILIKWKVGNIGNTGQLRELYQSLLFIKAHETCCKYSKFVGFFFKLKFFLFFSVNLRKKFQSLNF